MLVTIALPAYITSENMCYHVSELIAKICDQLTPDSELMVYDDGSPMCYYVDERALFVGCSINLGVAEARNRIINYTSGKYIAFVDADDDVPDDFVARCCEYASRGKHDIYQFQARHGDGNVAYPVPCAWGKLVSREWIGDDRFDPDQLIGEEDTLFLKKPADVCYVPEVNYYHCPTVNPDSLMKRFWRGELPRRRGSDDYAVNIG